MNYYEILYIVNPNFERKKIDEIMKEIEGRLNKTKSKIINHIIWGKKKLAYPIQDHNYGTYIITHYNGDDKNALDDFNSWLKLSDLVIRHMIVRLNNKPEIIEKTDYGLSSKSENEEKTKKDDAGKENVNETLNESKDDVDKDNINEETKGVE